MKNASYLRFAFTTLLLLLTMLSQIKAKPQQSPLPQITLLQHFLKTASWLKDSPEGQQKIAYTPLIKLSTASLEAAQISDAVPASWTGSWKNQLHSGAIELMNSHVFFQNALHRLVFAATQDQNLFCFLLSPDYQHKVLLFCPQSSAINLPTVQCFVLTAQKFDLANAFAVEKVVSPGFPSQLWGEYHHQPNGKSEVTDHLQADRIHALNREWTVLSTGASFKDQHRVYYVLAMDQRTGFVAYLQLYKPNPSIDKWELCLYPEFKVDGFRTNGHVLGQRFAQINVPQLIPSTALPVRH